MTLYLEIDLEIFVASFFFSFFYPSAHHIHNKIQSGVLLGIDKYEDFSRQFVLMTLFR